MKILRAACAAILSAWVPCGAAQLSPEQAKQDAARMFDFPMPRPARGAVAAPSKTPARAPAVSADLAAPGPAFGLKAALPEPPSAASAKKPRAGFFARAARWLRGLVEIPLRGLVQTVRNFAAIPGHMVRGLARGDWGALLFPVTGSLDVLWNLASLGLAEVNQAVAPVYGLIDKGQSGVQVSWHDGLLWQTGGPMGGLVHATRGPRYRNLMVSQVAVFSDKTQRDADQNPENPGDPYDNNAVNDLHEVILKDRRPVGYLTNFGIPWALSPRFHKREESSALDEAIKRLYPR